MRTHSSSRPALFTFLVILSVLQSSYLSSQLVKRTQDKRLIDLNRLPSDDEDCHSSAAIDAPPTTRPNSDDDAKARRKRRNLIEARTKRDRLKRIKEAPPDEKVSLLRNGRQHLTNREYLEIEDSKRREKMKRYFNKPGNRERLAEQRKRWYQNNRERILHKLKKQRDESKQARRNSAVSQSQLGSLQKRGLAATVDLNLSPPTSPIQAEPLSHEQMKAESRKKSRLKWLNKPGNREMVNAQFRLRYSQEPALRQRHEEQRKTREAKKVEDQKADPKLKVAADAAKAANLAKKRVQYHQNPDLRECKRQRYLEIDKPKRRAKKAQEAADKQKWRLSDETSELPVDIRKRGVTGRDFDLNELPAPEKPERKAKKVMDEAKRRHYAERRRIARRERERHAQEHPDAPVAYKITIAPERAAKSNAEYAARKRRQNAQSQARRRADPGKVALDQQRLRDYYKDHRTEMLRQRRVHYSRNRKTILEKNRQERSRKKLSPAQQDDTIDHPDQLSVATRKTLERSHDASDSQSTPGNRDHFTKRAVSGLDLDLNKSPPPSSPTPDPVALKRRRRSAYQAERRKRPGIREKEKAREAKYYKENYDAILLRSRHRYSQHRDAILARKKQQRSTLPKYQVYTSQRNYYYRNREKLLERSRDRYRMKKELQQTENIATDEPHPDGPTMKKRAYGPPYLLDLNAYPPIEDSSPSRLDYASNPNKAGAGQNRRVDQVRTARRNRFKRIRESNPDDKVVLLRSPVDPADRPSNKEYIAKIRKSGAERQARRLRKPGVAEEKRARDRLYYSLNKDKVKKRVNAHYLAHRVEIQASRRQKRRQKRLDGAGAIKPGNQETVFE